MKSWLASVAVFLASLLMLGGVLIGPPWLLFVAVAFYGIPLVMPAVTAESKVSASRTPLERLTERYVSQEDPDWDQFERAVAHLMTRPTRTPEDLGYSKEQLRRVALMRRRVELEEIRRRNRKRRGW